MIVYCVVGLQANLAPSFGLTYSWAILPWFLGVCCQSIVEPFHGSELKDGRRAEV